MSSGNPNYDPALEAITDKNEIISRLKRENNSLRKIIKAKDTLLLCYRVGNFGKADRALTIIERETKKLQKK